MRAPPCVADGRKRDAEVGHDRPAVLKEDVLRLEVPVDNAVSVRVVEGGEHGESDSERVVDRELLLAVEPRAQRLTLDVWHHIVQQPVGGAGVEEREEVRVLQVGRNADLTQEALDAEDRTETRGRGP